MSTYSSPSTFGAQFRFLHTQVKQRFELLHLVWRSIFHNGMEPWYRFVPLAGSLEPNQRPEVRIIFASLFGFTRISPSRHHIGFGCLSQASLPLLEQRLGFAN